MQEFETDLHESHKSSHDKKENKPKRSYYYDDAHGYEEYKPESDDEGIDENEDTDQREAQKSE